MSASTERKNRVAAREAGTDKKTIARQEAEKKAAKSRRQWTIGSILVAILLIAIILLNSGFLYKHTTAAKVGDRSYSPAEMNYYYANQYSSFVNQYGSYASLFGLDTSAGITSLGDQDCPMLEEGKTWRDYFMQSALSNMEQITALKNYATANGISLDADEIAEIDDELSALSESAKLYGYSGADNFLAAQYGTGVNTKLVRGLSIDSTLASKALQQYQDSLEYSDEQLEEYYASRKDSWDVFSYVYYYVAAEKLPVEDSENTVEGETVQLAVTEQSLLEARMSAEAIEMAYKDGADIEDLTERFNAAVEAEFEGDAATSRSRVAGSSLGDMSEWLLDSARSEGDLTVLEDSQGEGYYVVLFLSRDDNHYHTVTVRHILIKAEASEDGSYSDEAMQAALDKINEIKAEFESGDKSEDSFAALANEYSQDEGTNTKGGLYENITRGKTVQEFNDFCFGPHQTGDLGVVYGNNGTYAGYHLIYFVSENDLYSNQLAHDSMLDTDMDNFLTEQLAGYEPELRYWSKLVGKG